MTKTEIVADIARQLGFEPPPMSTGSTEPRLLFTMIIDRLGLDTWASTKHELARFIVESAGNAWRPSYESRGGTVTLDGLIAVRDAISLLVPDDALRPNFAVARSIPNIGTPNSIVLVEEDWDDSGYQTAYTMVFFDVRGSHRTVGELRIGQHGLEPGHRARPALPPTFDQLGDEFFSLGQDSNYYNRVVGLGPSLGPYLLTALRDMALDEDVYQRVSNEAVLKQSLLRTVPRSVMTGQFRRIANGGAKLTPYQFEFNWTNEGSPSPVQMKFYVEPNSKPPTNLHTIIGRNGAGKTRLLQAMANASVQDRASSDVGMTDANWLDSNQPSSSNTRSLPFAGLVLTSFSPFDEILPPEPDTAALSFTWIGFPSANSTEGSTLRPNLAALTQQLDESIEICMHGDRRQRWWRALRTLESDTIFAEAQFSTFASGPVLHGAELEGARHKLLDAFAGMSSGHKISLLAITRLVEKVEERSLVLIDEPESHLHPPLLASFIRAVTDLLTDRNGVGIVATHSPVVLQEVPRSCVAILRRSGTAQVVDRPTTETFGENISTLTREVFGLETTRSGFHRMLLDEIEGGMSFEQIEASFGGQLGTEARAVAYAAIAGRDANW